MQINQGVSWLCSEDIVDLKIKQSDCLRAFWPISLKFFSQIWHLYRNTVNNINFYYRINSVKLSGQIFEQIEKF